MTKSLTAAAQLFSSKIFKERSFKKVIASSRAKQDLAYEYWDDTPEVRFSGIWVGRSMSRARLMAGIVQKDGEIAEAPDNHPASVAVREMAGGPTGQSQFLEAMGPHLVVAGEGWVVIVPRGGLEESWHVVAPTAFKDKSKDGREGREVTIDGSEEMWVPAAGDTQLGTEPEPLAIRIWNPHPKNYAMADSPVMSSFTILDELRLLNAAVAAIAKSRLGGRGILTLPAGAKLPDGGDIMQALMEIAEVAYTDPSAAAAIVPIMIEIPKGEKIEHITFESTFDDLAIKLREESIRRYATASDTPAEVLLGQGDMNHWGVWAMKDEAIQVGVEPRLATVCDALTRQWLWPLLGDTSAVVWYDTAPLRVRTNRSETAIKLAEMDAISSEALRRETDFDEADAPVRLSAPVELAIKMITQAPSLAQDPGLETLVDQLRRLIPDDLGDPVAQDGEPQGSEEGLPVDETGAPPAEMPDPGDSAPDASDANVLAAAVDQIIVRALERAGHRLKKSNGRSSWAVTKDVAACAVHTRLLPTQDQLTPLLEGAWDSIGPIAQRYDINEQCLTDVLDEYCRDLLASGTEHRYEAIPILVRQASCLQLV